VIIATYGLVYAYWENNVQNRACALNGHILK